ncbi:MAG: hypothetical protein A3C35_07005 [Omnitrophica bacterium RIFCSPHIGHO2_02_FULL_46_11]|nr:MAG: hypothetical protein A3A81_06845 [Omnitrophica bacterium RIFCSPLOWO2_01_FULL_45_10b]OGW87233.1 MAG: hypothetical protein A3C35_07005 [Omnitrophica bacterium RIFCSPHIGHO2_02_FULL_46_11]
MKFFSKRVIYLSFVIIFSFFSLGAWWDLNKSKKEKSPANTVKEAPEETVSTLLPESSLGQSEIATKTVAPAAEEPPVQAEEQIEKPVEQIKKKGEKKVSDKFEETPESRGEVEKIQGELKDIIERTQQLQQQVRGNRDEIQKILQRAQIHERILRTMNVPGPVQLKSQIDTEEILKREKLRIISEQTQKTQQQLRAIQQMKSIAKVPKTS